MISEPIDYAYLERTLCDKLRYMITVLKHVGANRVINVGETISKLGYNPCISSIFSVGAGSRSYDDGTYGCVSIHNGTIQHIEGIDAIDLRDTCAIYARKFAGDSQVPRRNKATIHIVETGILIPLKEELELKYPGICAKMCRGDIIENALVSGYRSEGISFWDGTDICDQSREFDDYGAPPPEFHVVSEFPPGYWSRFGCDLPTVDWTNQNKSSEFYWHAEMPPCAINAEKLNIYPIDNGTHVIPNTPYQIEINNAIDFNEHQRKFGYTPVMWDGAILRDEDW